MHALMRPALWTMLVQATLVASQLAVDVLVARALGPALLGELVFAFSVAGLLSIVVLFGTGEIAIALYCKREHEPAAILTASAIIWGAGTSAALSLSALIVWALGLPWLSAACVMWAVVILGINGMASVLNQAIVAFDASGRDMRVTLASRMTLLAGVGAATWAGSLGAVLAVYALAALVWVAGRAWVVHRHLFALRWCWRADVLATLWRRGRAVGLGSIFGTLSNRADMLALRLYVGAAATGLYGTAYRVVTGLEMLASSASFALYPWLHGDHAARARWAKRLYVVLPLVALAGAAVVWACDPGAAMAWVFGEPYRAAGDLLRWLVIAAGLQVVRVFGARWLIVIEREAVLPRLQLVAACCNGAGLVVLLPSYGAEGAAMATLAAEVVATSATLWWVTTARAPAKEEVLCPSV